jgi:hypothetical protein
LDEWPPLAHVAKGNAEGCVICGSSDVRYMLIADVLGSSTRIGLCSAECLGSQLGVVLVSPTDASRETKQ